MKCRHFLLLSGFFALPLTADTGVSENPALKNKQYQADLTDAYARIDPRKDGWNSEARGELYATALKDFAKHLIDPKSPYPEAPQCQQFRPTAAKAITLEGGIVIKRGLPKKDLLPFKNAVPDWKKKFKTKVKVTRIQPTSCEALVTLKSPLVQINYRWKCSFDKDRLTTVEVIDYEEVISNHPRLLSDITSSVLGKNASYHEQLLRSTDHWRQRLPRDFGLDPAANHGLALGDVNGDGLEDLYLCQQGGLPNKLFLRQPDGTLLDFSAESKTDWMDFCAAALIIDLDNDGDKDLVISQDFKILFMENMDGKGHFELTFGSSTTSQSFSMSAADFDQDGLLDVYICGYNPSYTSARAGALGEPVPFHDANNGGPNMLWRNLGEWLFEDVAEKCGLHAENTRFSFAAAWEDYDQDGDLDLYVANDFGRNCLYQNQGSKDKELPFFVNIAAALKVEDSSAGMSASWGDFNRDGWTDLYVSNMFSSAGNRITYQDQFKAGTDEKTRATFQRMARGNTLFSANGHGGFKDVSMEAGTTMARWCWGSTFADLNNDGWLDILAANGFITAEDTGDL